MRRPVLVRLVGLLALALAAGTMAPTVARSPLVSYDDAARCGLVRSWYAQAPVDYSRSRVEQWKLFYDRIYATSTAGLLTEFDAETGETTWTTSIGAPGAAAFGPGVNLDYVAIVSASKLYLLDRRDGHVIWSRDLGSAPAAGPALSDRYAFVALLSGRIEAYDLKDPEAQPWYYSSAGRSYQRPTVTGRVVSWPTTTGYLYVASAEDPRLLYRLETNDEIVASPVEQRPYLYAASRDGYIYCVQEITGAEKWRFSTGYAIESKPAVVGDVTFAASQEPALHALDSKTGEEGWVALGLSSFVARGKERVYAADTFGNIYVIELKSGQYVNGLTVPQGTQTIVNDQTDRIFLVNDRGLVQCLHEQGVDMPTKYREPPARTTLEPVEADADAAVNPFDAGGDEPSADEDAGDEGEDEGYVSPFEPAASPFGGDEGAGEESPFGNVEDLDENPFGF